MADYAAFINRKSQLGELSGFSPLWMRREIDHAQQA